MNDEIIIKEHLGYPHIIEMTDNEKREFIHGLSFINKLRNPGIDSNVLELLMQSIRGIVIVKKNSNFSMLYGDCAFMLSGAMYTYLKSETEGNIQINCLLNKKIYGDSEIPIIPNNSYINSLMKKLSFQEFIEQSKEEKENVNVYAMASQDTELLIFDLQMLIDIPYINEALNYYLLEFTRYFPKIAAIGDRIRHEKSLSPLYDSFPGLAGEYTLEDLRLFFGIPFGTWRRYL